MLNPDDMQALGLFGQQQPDPYGMGSVDQILGVQPLAFNPGPSPQAPAPAPGQGGDKIAGNEEVLDHLATVMKSSASGAAPSAPKGMVKAGETVKTTDDGMTPEQRATGVAVRGQAGLDTAQVVADRKEVQAQQFEAHASKLRAEAAVEEEQRQKAEQENEARASRIREHQYFLAKQSEEPVNPNRYFENMSVFGKAAAILSAFSYGYLNPRGQGTAPIITQLMQLASEDTKAQMANNQEGRARRGDLIALYERRYGDTSLVAKKLEADKLQTLSKKALADADESKSAEAKAAAEDLAKNIGIQADVKNREVEEAYAAKPVSERTTSYKPPAGPGDAGAKYLKQQKEVAELDKLWETQGVPKEERYARLSKLGMPAPAGNTAAENKRADDKAAADAKARELTPAEKTDLREKTDGLASAMQGFDELDKQLGIARRAADGEVLHARPDASEVLSPSDLAGGVARGIAGVAEIAPWEAGKGMAAALQRTLPDDHKATKRLANTITDNIMRAKSGAGTNAAEVEEYRGRMPIDSGTETFMRSSAEQVRVAQQEYKNMVGQFGKEAVDELLRKKGVDVQAKFGKHEP